jgi:hypothetical protein
MTQFVPPNKKQVKIRRKEKKTLAWLIISADFLQGKSAFFPSVILGFWSSEGRTQGNLES